MGEIIRRRHGKNKEKIKKILIDEINKTEYSSVVEWDGYNFHASQLLTSVKGEITDDEIVAEVYGLGSGKVAKELEKVLDSLV